MSYIKISQLPEATGITNEDYLVIVDDPLGSPVTRKIKAENALQPIIDEIDGGDIS